jgi:5-methyltetrahydrofolate--homocysteine methyltransferase
MPDYKRKPETLGKIELSGIDLSEIAPFIDWTFFFLAWRITGNYKGIETLCNCTSCEVSWLQQFPDENREKAKEALKLYRDAQEMLRRFSEEKILKINALVNIYPAFSDGENIVVETENGQALLPLLRQQSPSSDGFCYSLADFLDEKDDFIGVFACTVTGAEEAAKESGKDDNMYRAILIKTLSDRLAEATAEWLHYQVRRKYWAYAPEETMNVESMLKAKYEGIRPAVGYPSLPDLSIIFELDKLLDYGKTGITLTENGAMYPNASVSGLYFAHPKSRYFAIGKIDGAQLEDYARRRGKSVEEMKKWLAANIV